MTATASTRVRSEAGVVAYLGFTSALLALRIDTALPAFDEIREEFSLADGSGGVSLVVTAYFLGMAAGQLPMGPLSDRFGRRPVLLASFALYLIGALGASLAPSFAMLLGARFLWGLGAAPTRRPVRGTALAAVNCYLLAPRCDGSESQLPAVGFTFSQCWPRPRWRAAPCSGAVLGVVSGAACVCPAPVTCALCLPPPRIDLDGQPTSQSVSHQRTGMF